MVELINKIIELGKKSKQRQELVDTLRVYVKYMLFDLEATRRENLQLKELLHRQENG